MRSKIDIDFQTAQDDHKTPQVRPRRRSERQEGAKRAPRRRQEGPKKRVALSLFPGMAAKSPQEPSKTHQDRSKTPPRSIFHTISEPTWLLSATQKATKIL